MIRNILKLALRKATRDAVFSIVNIGGMAIAMSCAILLLLWVQYQLSFDRFYQNADRLYRIIEKRYTGDKFEMSARSAYPLVKALKENYPEIKHASVYNNFWETFFREDNVIEGTVATVDRDFFEMFDIVFIKGNPENALNGPRDIILTEDMAARYFGNEDPLGKSMINGPDNVFTVTGVIKNFPRNSHFYIDCLVSVEFLKTKFAGNLNDWKNPTVYSFIELEEGSDSRKVEEKIKGVIKSNLERSDSEIFMQNIKRIRLHSRGYTNDIEFGSITQVRLATLVALLILSIACINFMNLLTAQSSGRAKEIGVRKIAGAGRLKIIGQFLGESLLTIFAAIIIAMILVELFLPAFNTVMLTRLKVSYLGAVLYIILMAVVLFCGLLAGSYPALYMSSLQPANTLKGIIIINAGKARLRRILVISQFSLAFLFITSTFIVNNQLSYMNSKNFGADINNICYFDFNERVKRETLKNELLGIPGISDVTITDHLWVVNNWSTSKGFTWDGKKEGEDVIFTILMADKDYAKTFRLELKEGNYLAADEFSSDNSAIVINEKAAELLGFKNPVGEIITKDSLRFTIVGVLKNFHFKSFHFPIDPLLIAPIHPSLKEGKCYVRINSDSVSSAVSKIRLKFNLLYPDYPVNIGFVEDDYNDLNRIEKISGTMFGYFTFVAIIISILGLLGLSTFITVRRTKEIGIRKVHGAKTSEIFFMLSKEYIWLIIISFLIASPIAWFATNMWLQTYAYRVNLNLWLFVLALLVVVVITILTVGLHSYRAASKNPVEALRNE